MGVIGWLVLGLVAGALARFLVPGRDPMGLLGTLVLGLAGSLLGGFLADLIFDDEAVGLFGSVVGAVIVLLAYNAWVRRESMA
ncbi:MAG: GlsB/YeaQ/YmgE family stress response membrane protein [Actinomycetota bacterium]|jgi:uncharacterized membrane protein YeaQ/YmgE (transglycosylase-associated protein family)|nr:GlsB/YeaQ/YmgE family stress response membrane protein [Actinomycetota bacterium]